MSTRTVLNALWWFLAPLLLTALGVHSAQVAGALVPRDLPFDQGLLAHYPLRGDVKEASGGPGLVYHNRQNYDSFGLRLEGGPQDFLKLTGWDRLAPGKQITVGIWVRADRLDHRLQRGKTIFWDGHLATPWYPRFDLSIVPYAQAWSWGLAYKQALKTDYSWRYRQALTSTIDVEKAELVAYLDGRETLRGAFEPRGFRSAEEMAFGYGHQVESGLPGVYGEITLWSRVLEPNEARALYDHQRKRITQYTLLRWAILAGVWLAGAAWFYWTGKALHHRLERRGLLAWAAQRLLQQRTPEA